MFTPRSYAQYQTGHIASSPKSSTKDHQNVKQAPNFARGGYGNGHGLGHLGTMLKSKRNPAASARRPSPSWHDDAKAGASPSSKSSHQNVSPHYAITSQYSNKEPLTYHPSNTQTERLKSEPVLLPSRPVVIPPRSAASITSHPAHAHTTRARRPYSENSSGRMSSRTRGDASKHNPKALPPAVAALLAVTSIPRHQSPRRRRTRESPSPSPSPSNVDELIQHWREEEYGNGAYHSSVSSFPTSSPLDLLLERPRSSRGEPDTTAGASEDYDQSCDESDSETTGNEDQPESVRSTSTRSMSSCSIPSLEPPSDCPSFSSVSVSGSSMPFTPASHTYSTSSPSNRREKCLNSPPSEACVDSHPLISPILGPDSLFPDDPLPFPELTLPDTVSPPTTRSSSISPPPKSRKSNLTASLSAFRATRLLSAFSNSLTEPSLPSTPGTSTVSASIPPTSPPSESDSLSSLARSIYGDVSTRRFPSEMRPRWSWSAEMPVPESVRRYFNPAPPTGSSGGRLGYLSPGTRTSRGTGSNSADGSGRRASNIAVEPGDVHRHANMVLRAEEPAGTQTKGKMILLRTYNKSGPGGQSSNVSHPSTSISPRRKRGGATPDKAGSASAPGSEVGRLMAEAGSGQPMFRLREPRENSDFLRVIVLEMNMRRVGKLDRKAGGRAKIWLPPRVVKVVEEKEVGGDGGEKGKDGRRERVPERWRGWSVDEEW